jgi:hypothetical protein
MTDPVHEPTVKWKDETVLQDKIDLGEWRRRKLGDVYSVIGWCPICRARAEAIVEPPADPGVGPLRDDKDEAKEPGLIRVQCECGEPHEKEGAESCGRQWYIDWNAVEWAR